LSLFKLSPAVPTLVVALKPMASLIPSGNPMGKGGWPKLSTECESNPEAVDEEKVSSVPRTDWDWYGAGADVALATWLGLSLELGLGLRVRVRVSDRVRVRVRVRFRNRVLG